MKDSEPKFIEVVSPDYAKRIGGMQTLKSNMPLKVVSSEKSFKDEVSIEIDCSIENLANSLIKLSEASRKELTEALTKPSISIVTKGLEDQKPMTFALDTIIRHVVKSANKEAMKVLLDAGIAKTKEFIMASPLHLAVAAKDIDMVRTILENKDSRRKLMNKKDDLASDILHFANLKNNEKIISAILKYPEGRELLSVQNEWGFTPLKNAHDTHNSPEVIGAFRKGELSIAKDQLASYFVKQLQGKGALTTTNLATMKQEVIKKLSPLALNELEAKEINNYAGSIVRDAAKISGKTLDWQQKIIKIKNVIKESLSNIFSTPKQRLFADIVKDPRLAETLKNFRVNEFLSTASLGKKMPPAPPKISRAL